MPSNFEFLEKNFPVLADYGRKAENYLYSDSNSCLMKLGMIGETIVNLIFKYDRISIPYDNTAVIRIDTLYREGLIDTEIQDILHSLRKARNSLVSSCLPDMPECPARQALSVFLFWFAASSTASICTCGFGDTASRSVSRYCSSCLQFQSNSTSLASSTLS